MTPTPSASAAMKLAGGFFTTKMDWLDDRIFNWGRADDSETNDIFFFMVSAQRRDSMENEDDGYAGDREDGQRSKKDV
ncbi:hypothetical protein BC936DRAFT_139449 [Jimgerdemannia flammicorona]|uniref:Uncharacterized protein n=1 Tax=Jimgerdemannia flammicorona TaxID=994334 RepID=A0A433B9V3_9FUNG|nr:hypothetical protein BC936DRAFT_139449 [Jimgerdemannia flammicorona]